jgi:iron-sulfur cluster assembly 1
MIRRLILLSLYLVLSANAFVVFPSFSRPKAVSPSGLILRSTEVAEPTVDYEVPEDAVISIKPKAMNRLRELRAKQNADTLILRMGVRNGGCSGLSYVMDFSTEDEIGEDDQIDEYKGEGIKCVVDAKSMLYLFGLELDYSEELIGGGFKVSPCAVS